MERITDAGTSHRRRAESDLYGPVKQFLEEQGFTVRGEVEGCDIVAVRGADLVIVELKRSFTLNLVLQGIARQQVAEHVYLAVEAPRRVRGRWREEEALCRRLGLGLIAVSFTRSGPVVQVALEPDPQPPRRSKPKRERLLREFQQRTGDHNTGGTTRRPIVTAYREEALRVAAYLHQHGPSAVRDVRSEAGSPRAGTILQDNVYRWFERVERGVYRLTAQGEEALLLFADVVKGS